MVESLLARPFQQEESVVTAGRLATQEYSSLGIAIGYDEAQTRLIKLGALFKIRYEQDDVADIDGPDGVMDQRCLIDPPWRPRRVDRGGLHDHRLALAHSKTQTHSVGVSATRDAAGTRVQRGNPTKPRDRLAQGLFVGAAPNHLAQGGARLKGRRQFRRAGRPYPDLAAVDRRECGAGIVR